MTDVLAVIHPGLVYDLIVPEVYSGKDKLLYIVEHNDNWTGNNHNAIKANGVLIERLKSSYNQNPFATHCNNKLYDRYLASRVPKELLDPNSNFVKIEIDMRNMNIRVHFREVGTHDIE